MTIHIVEIGFKSGNIIRAASQSFSNDNDRIFWEDLSPEDFALVRDKYHSPLVQSQLSCKFENVEYSCIRETIHI